MSHLLFAFGLAFLSTVHAHDSGTVVLPAYNEAVHHSGDLRESYADFTRQTGIKPYPVKTEAVTTLLGKPLNDAIKVLPIPTVLSDQEYAKLQAGAELRARTLLAFFADVIFHGSAKVLASGLLTEAQIQAIFKAESSTYNLSHLRQIYDRRSEKDLSAVMGPDVVRNSRGEFRVLEDNVGPIGGLGDLAAVHNAYFGMFGPNPNLQPPMIQAIEAFLKDIPRGEWSDRAIFVCHASKKSANRVTPVDEEDLRVREIADVLGIKVIEFSSFTEDSEDLKKLLSGQYSKVINLQSLYNFGDLAVARDLFQAFRAKKFDLFTSPGLDAVGSKSMLPFVDKLTQVYFSKPATLLTQPTEWVMSAKDLEGLKSGWVVKKTDGAQGSEVYILDQLSDEGRKILISHVVKWEAYSELENHMAIPYFVKQEIVDPSFLPAEIGDTWVKFNVDYRPHVFVVNGEPLKPAIWGRAVWKIPGVLNNVSQSAMEMVVTTPNRCERMLMQPAQGQQSGAAQLEFKF